MISLFNEVRSPPTHKDLVELIGLYRSIEGGLQRRSGLSVAITSAQHTDHVLQLSYNLAWVASTLLGKRVLVLDAGKATHRTITHDLNSAQPGIEQTPLPPRTVNCVVTDVAPKQALMEVDQVLGNTGNVGLLSLRVTPNNNVAVMPQVVEVWGKLQSTFDLIIVATPPVLDDATATCLSDIVSGSVLIVCSGLSRQKEVTRAIDLLSSGAAPLIGVVMMDRQHAFPRWLRRIFSVG